MSGPIDPWDSQSHDSTSPTGRSAFAAARDSAYRLGVGGSPLTQLAACQLHEEIFEPLGCQPRARIGTTRTSLDLDAYVLERGSSRTRWVTSVPDLVDEHLAKFFRDVDEVVVEGKRQGPEYIVSRLPIVVAAVYSDWLRIHPFNDGNGRVGVCIVDWLCGRLEVARFMMLGPTSEFSHSSAASAVKEACQPKSSRDLGPLSKVFEHEMLLGWPLNSGA
jgi:hypothetical protein